MSKSMATAKTLDRLLREAGDAELAAPMKKYMKDHFEFYGVKADQRKVIMRLFLNEYGKPEDWRSFVRECWECEGREVQMVAMEIVYRLKKEVKKEDLPHLEFMIVNKSWWDSVDFIASNIMGYYFFTYPDQIEPITSVWIESEKMWLNRTCLLFQLKYKDYTNFKLLQKFIHRHKYSNEFFLQKAIGWALRQYAKTSPKAVRAFVAETELKRLSRREALKHFS